MRFPPFSTPRATITERDMPALMRAIEQGRISRTTGAELLFRAPRFKAVATRMGTTAVKSDVERLFLPFEGEARGAEKEAAKLLKQVAKAEK
jgi:adenylylsulfate kinase-like enzyme